MFSLLAVSYLFLGGAGAGALVVALLIDLVWLKEPFGGASRVSIDEALPSERAVAFALMAGLLALILGVLCLVFDLGRIDRLISLFVSPSVSFLTLGAYALGALVLCAATLVVVRFAYFPSISRTLVAIVEIVTVVLGFVVMAYTGLLLQSVGGVAFWNSLWMPIIFVLSSLSCGIAIVLLVSVFGETDARVVYLVRRLALIDVAILILEGIAACLLVGLALGSTHPATLSSVQQLLQGPFAALWWGGFVVCGLGVPLVIEALSQRSRFSAPVVLAIAALFVLVGGFSMRSAIVDVGEHRDLMLEEPLSLALELPTESEIEQA